MVMIVVASGINTVWLFERDEYRDDFVRNLLAS